MEKEYQISWVKIIGITALIAIIIIIICLIYPKNDRSSLLTQQTYINNITLMKDAGFEYFNGSNLPTEIGDSKRITLDEMLARNLIVDFLDEEGNSCNTGNSYVEVTKTYDQEYEMSVFLSCNNKSDYIVTSISNEVVCTDCNVIVDSNNGNESGSNASDNGSSNDIRQPIYSTDNNTNSSGNDSNSERPIQVTQTTNININYVNTCCTNGNSSNCNDHCLTNVYHSVVFDANGGSLVQTQRIKHGQTAQYRTTYRVGYEFLGWYLNGEKYDFSTPVTEKITLVAKWKKKDMVDHKEAYWVYFESNGGSYVSDQEVLEGEFVSRPTDPTRDCYNFAGWYTNSSLTQKYDFSTPVTSDMTLYAKWVNDGSCKNTYTVRFNSNGGTSVSLQRVVEGNRAYEPTDPTRSGYRFLGWYLNNSKFNFNTRIYGDITLTAKWEKEEEEYYTYCKVNTERYYSVGYVPGSKTTWNYDWSIRFDDLRNIEDLKVVQSGYLTTSAMYNNAYRAYYNQSISMVNGNYQYAVALGSGTNLKNYSLKSTNFNKYLSEPYYRNGSWYIDASVSIKNYNNVNSYYVSNLGNSVYFVPFYFDLEYTDLKDCVDDKASNRSKYSDYEIVDRYWK